MSCQTVDVLDLASVLVMAHAFEAQDLTVNRSANVKALGKESAVKYPHQCLPELIHISRLQYRIDGQSTVKFLG